MILLAMLLVLLPLILALIAARLTERLEVALVGMPLALLVSWRMLRLRGHTWKDVGLRSCPLSSAAIIGNVLLSTFILVVGVGIVGALLKKGTGVGPDLSKFDAVRGNVTLLFAGLALVWTSAAFGEEMLFRGFYMHSVHLLLQRSGVRRGGWMISAIITSVMFGIGHIYQGLAGVIMTFLIGLGFAAAFFLGKRSLLCPILIHGLYDTFGFLILFFSLDKQTIPS